MLDKAKTPMDMLLDQVDWRPVEAPADRDGLPYPTHEGLLRIVGDIGLRCYVLSDGSRVINKDDVEDLLRADAADTTAGEGR